MKSKIKPLCKSNGWILEQKNKYRKCYKTTKFSVSEAKMEYSVVELRKNFLRNSGLVTIAISFIVAIISKVNIDIMNGIVSINLKKLRNSNNTSISYFNACIILDNNVLLL